MKYNFVYIMIWAIYKHNKWWNTTLVNYDIAIYKTINHEIQLWLIIYINKTIDDEIQHCLIMIDLYIKQ